MVNEFRIVFGLIIEIIQIIAITHKVTGND